MTAESIRCCRQLGVTTLVSASLVVTTLLSATFTCASNVTVAIKGGDHHAAVAFSPLQAASLPEWGHTNLHAFAPDLCAVSISHLIEPLQRPQSSQTSADALAATIESKPSYTEARPELKGLLYKQVSLTSMQAAGS